MMLLRVLGLGFGLDRLESSTRKMIPRTAQRMRPFGDAGAAGILMVVAIARRRRGWAEAEVRLRVGARLGRNHEN